MTGFESPDPVYWVQQGYAVLQADVSWHAQIGREGNAGVLRQWDAEDYFDLIEWTASQPWCTGRVGLIGVSYLTMSQWYVAALKPPHLCAMVPWEGVTDLYRELAFHGGIPKTRFVPVWSMRLKLGRNRRFPPAEDFLAETEAHPLDDACWALKRAVLENIEVQALVCANWSDHGLHTRGSIEGFERISSRQKWLFTHGRKKWETFYSEEALAWQKQFMDHFLRVVDNRMDRVPKVRLEVQKPYYQQEVRSEQSWPHASVQPALLYLCANTGSLQKEPVACEGKVQYRPASRGSKAAFSLRVERAIELIGSKRLKLLGQHLGRRRSGSVRSPTKARFHGERGFLLRFQWIRARWPCQGMASRFTPRAGPVVQHAAAPMAQPYSYSKTAVQRHCASGDRDLAVCDALRGRIYSAVNDPRSGCR
jgi:uncharacterized protein